MGRSGMPTHLGTACSAAEHSEVCPHVKLAAYSFTGQGTVVTRTTGLVAALFPAGVITWGTSVLLRPFLSPPEHIAKQLQALRPERWPVEAAARYASPIAIRFLLATLVAAIATGGTSAAIESLMFRPTPQALEARARRTTISYASSDLPPADPPSRA